MSEHFTFGAGAQAPQSMTSSLDRSVVDDLTRAPQVGAGQDAEIPVPSRPGFTVLFDLVAAGDYDRREVLERQCTRPDGSLHALNFAVALIASCSIAIHRDGEPIGEGGELTFASSSLRELLGVDDSASAVRAFYGSDPAVLQASGSLSRRAGWGDIAVDPTTRSSSASPSTTTS